MLVRFRNQVRLYVDSFDLQDLRVNLQRVRLLILICNYNIFAVSIRRWNNNRIILASALDLAQSV